ncbi:MAG: hypothetical protein ACOC8X_09655, partial [Chloroflexota bacterium]
MDRREAVDQLKQTYLILSQDLDEIVAYGKSNPSPFAHRTLVRTHFALIEGLSYQMRQVTLASLEKHEGLLTPEEICLLREEKYEADSNGSVKARTQNLRPLPGLLFSIECYLKNHGATFKPDTSVHGWECMKKLVKIRNNLTHPKSSADLQLSEEDLMHVAKAAGWWK